MMTQSISKVIHFSALLLVLFFIWILSNLYYYYTDANGDSGDQGENNNTTTGNPLSPLPQTHGVSVTERQLNYAKLLMELNQPLPLDNNQLPYWPVALLPNGNLHGS
jgi:hypothetical protein